MKIKEFISIPDYLASIDKPHGKKPNIPYNLSVLTVILFGIFAGSAFSPYVNTPLAEKRSIPHFFEVNPTPIPGDAYDGKKIALLPAAKIEGALPEKSDLDFASYRYHSWDIPDDISVGNDFWIEIDLTNQRLYAYRDNQLINAFKVSTGTSNHRTVTGTFKIFTKYPAITMTGPGYDLEGVPFSMFFYKGYAIHGTYWHNNFGTPMSHGCVNMNTDDAAWIYKNAPVGTYIMVHY